MLIPVLNNAISICLIAKVIAKQTAERKGTHNQAMARRHFHKNLPIKKTSPTTMLHVVETLILGILVSAKTEATSVYCPGNRQYVDIPDLYDKETPEYAYTDIEKVTEVYLHFEIFQLKSVQEER